MFDWINSERSEECIDFTMMYVFFFVSVYSITSRNNAPVSNYGGGFRCKIFKKIEKNKKKLTEKREFLRKSIQIFTKSVENAKICNFENLVQGSPLIFLQISVKKHYRIQTKNFYECLKFKFLQNRILENFTSYLDWHFLYMISFSKYFNVDKIFLTLSKYLIHRHNFFLLTFEVQILTKIRQNHEYLQIILLFKIHKIFSISFASKGYKENFKRHYRKNVLGVSVLNFYEIGIFTDKPSPLRIVFLIRSKKPHDKSNLYTLKNKEIAPFDEERNVYTIA
ncbi:hypothetical protein AGLY_009748, partial [Aphis glycines]